MASKGIVWMIVAIGVIFLAEILIFSFMFSQVTFFSREVFDANIVFEGDELETYARSIENSVQLSLAQGAYDFYLGHVGESWQSFSQKSVPTTADIQGELNEKASGYAYGFFDAHQTFAIEQGNGIVFTLPNSSSVKLDSGKVSMKFEPEMEMRKNFQGTVSYTRRFVAESDLTTVFGEMVSEIRSMINGDKIGSYVVEGIGKPQSGSKSSCSVPDRNGNTDLHSYIDEDTALPPGNQAFANLTKHLDGSQTQTQGSVRFCNLDATISKGCSCNDPCGNPSESLPRMGDPAPSTVYSMTHTQSFESGAVIIADYAEQRLLCLEAELDHASERYTVAFDGDNTGSPQIVTNGEIKESSCSLGSEGTECSGVTVGTCGTCPTPGGGSTPKYRWECPIVHTKTCSFDHLGSGSAQIRYQEDGFIYRFNDNGNPVDSSIKLVFQAKSGNKDIQ